jgi:uncharacterized protein YjbI with pentapeptide repeats
LANLEHLAKLKEGVEAWNEWRQQDDRHTQPDLSEADLTGLKLNDAEFHNTDLSRAILVDDLRGVNFRGANLHRATFSQPPFLHDSILRGVNLSEVDLTQVNFEGKDLTAANFSGSSLEGADLSKSTLLSAQLEGTNLRYAHMNGADLRGANLLRADLRGASLQRVNLIQTNLAGADLTGCGVYGISAWDLNLEGTRQSNLIITPNGEPPIQVDNLEVAQFIYLLLNNERIRSVIDTITSKVVLILGRFTPERKVVLDAIRDELRTRDYLPVLFDFEKPANKDLTGTISTLANLARFIIADLTDPSSVPHELATVVPGTVVPVQAIILEGQREYAMFPDLVRRHHWVLEPYQYKSRELLIANLGERVIAPAEAKAKELAWK